MEKIIISREKLEAVQRDSMEDDRERLKHFKNTPRNQLNREKITARIDKIRARQGVRARQGEDVPHGTIPTEEDFTMRETYVQIEEAKQKARERAIRASEQIKIKGEIRQANRRNK